MVRGSSKPERSEISPHNQSLECGDLSPLWIPSELLILILTPIQSADKSAHSKKSGSDVAGNMRVFQTRFESSNLSFRSKQHVRQTSVCRCPGINTQQTSTSRSLSDIKARVAKRPRRRIANPVS